MGRFNKSELATWISSIVSLLILLGAIGGSWYSVSTRITVLELEAADAKADHLMVEKLKSVILTQDPQTLPILGAKSPVHTFGWKLSGSDLPADAAQMPRKEKP